MHSDQNFSKSGFTPTLSRVAVFLAAIGGTVGSGWLLTSFHAAEVAGPAAIFSWIIGGLLMMFIGYTFVILTRTMPITGGTVRFLQISHGHFTGFSFAWIAWIAWVAVTPNEILAIVQYATNYMPSLMHKVNGSQTLTLRGLEVSIVLMIMMYFINIKGIQWLSRMNMTIVVFKLVIPLATFFILLFYSFHFHNFHTVHGFAPFGFKGVLAALPAAGVIYCFIGFNPAIQMASEIKNPGKSIGFAVFGSTIFCIILYCLLQVVFIGSLSPASFAKGWQSITFAGDAGPFAGMIMAIGITWFVKLLYVDAVISPFGTGMVQAAATSRLTYGMAKNHYLPGFLVKVNNKQSPANAAAFNIIIGLVFFLPFPTWQKMMSFLTSCIVIGYVVGPISLSTLYHTMPEQMKSHSRWKIEVISLFAFYICNLIIFWVGWQVVYKILITFAIGYGLLFCYKLFSRKGRELHLNIAHGWWVLPYLIGMGVLSYLGSYGGGRNDLPFGWDFVAMALFSIVIFYIALKLSTGGDASVKVHQRVAQIKSSMASNDD
ncbi:MAG: APC family permease [Pseudomonadota bacterium]